MELEKAYDPKKYEGDIYRLWEQSGYFNPDNLPGERRERFSVTMAPPNITGSLHMGHALEYTLSDILVRKKRMEGQAVLWLPGTDHAGIATQNVVEKELKKEGLNRHRLGREKFLERIWAWKEKYGNVIVDQLKSLGASADWTRARFTMDDGYKVAVETAFRHYYEKKWLYKAERVVNWCPRCATSLSDLELEYKEEETTLYTFRYARGFPVPIATTRPETKLGDTAVAVHPDDKRYKDYVGRTFEVEFVGVPLTIKVVADESVDPKFGTGAVGVTPAHSLTDWEISERHDLPLRQVIDENGRVVNASPELNGETTLAAREKIVQWLKENNLLEKEEKIIHNLATCYRCESAVEPLPSRQWFLKMDELAKTAIEAVKKGEIKFHPKRWEKIYLDWLENVRDWNISRQIWWGHKIPLEGEDDVLDTWFSSALWPFATLGWPASPSASQGGSDKTDDLSRYYPTNVLTNDRGIINLWDARMIFSGYEFMKEKPFRDIIVHATVLTADGRRMSKSLGTGVDPMGLIGRDGADALRFALVWQSLGGQDLRWDETAVTAGRKFANKLWNVARYILSKQTGEVIDAIEEDSDGQILKKLESVKNEVEKNVENYDFGQALHQLYDFIWHDLADQYIEQTKDRQDPAAAKTLRALLTAVLKLLHPFMPFVTEAIWQKLPQQETDLLMIAPWPK